MNDVNASGCEAFEPAWCAGRMAPARPGETQHGVGFHGSGRSCGVSVMTLPGIVVVGAAVVGDVDDGRVVVVAVCVPSLRNLSINCVA